MIDGTVFVGFGKSIVANSGFCCTNLFAYPFSYYAECGSATLNRNRTDCSPELPAFVAEVIQAEGYLVGTRTTGTLSLQIMVTV